MFLKRIKCNTHHMKMQTHTQKCGETRTYDDRLDGQTKRRRTKRQKERNMKFAALCLCAPRSFSFFLAKPNENCRCIVRWYDKKKKKKLLFFFPFYLYDFSVENGKFRQKHQLYTVFSHSIFIFQICGELRIGNRSLSSAISYSFQS